MFLHQDLVFFLLLLSEFNFIFFDCRCAGATPLITLKLRKRGIKYEMKKNILSCWACQQKHVDVTVADLEQPESQQVKRPSQPVRKSSLFLSETITRQLSSCSLMFAGCRGLLLTCSVKDLHQFCLVELRVNVTAAESCWLASGQIIAHLTSASKRLLFSTRLILKWHQAGECVCACVCVLCSML